VSLDDQKNQVSAKVRRMTPRELWGRLEFLRGCSWVVCTNEGTFSPSANLPTGDTSGPPGVYHVVWYADGRGSYTTNPAALRLQIGTPRQFRNAESDARLARYEFVCIELELERRGLREPSASRG
jgi:hypothetical protein